MAQGLCTKPHQQIQGKWDNRPGSGKKNGKTKLMDTIQKDQDPKNLISKDEEALKGRICKLWRQFAGEVQEICKAFKQFVSVWKLFTRKNLIWLRSYL